MRTAYQRIIDLPHYSSEKRGHIPRSKRAAQFAPFAALSGYEEAVEETGRLTVERVEPDESEKEEINRHIVSALGRGCDIALTYFVPDKKKSGGSYAETSGAIRWFDEYRRELVMEDGKRIPVDDITSASTGADE